MAMTKAGKEAGMKPPTEITVCHLEVVVMPNGEVICAGQSLGWVNGKGGLGKYLTVIDACRQRNPDADERQGARR